MGKMRTLNGEVSEEVSELKHEIKQIAHSWQMDTKVILDRIGNAESAQGAQQQHIFPIYTTVSTITVSNPDIVP
jgi:hypothetical protein